MTKAEINISFRNSSFVARQTGPTVARYIKYEAKVYNTSVNFYRKIKS